MTSFEATAAAQAHVGWTQAETDLLRARAAQILQEGRPLREVFEEIARKTGRKSGSVRNYYYAAIRPQLRRDMALPGGANGAHGPFVPFTGEEIRDLLRAVLMAVGRGASVRQATMELAGGDKTRMLRYQNKYRSLLRSHPALVGEVVAELREQGVPVKDPFAGKAPLPQAEPAPGEAAASAPEWDEAELASALSRIFSLLRGQNGPGVMALVMGLEDLASRAARAGSWRKRLEQFDALSARHDLLAVRLQQTQQELEAANGQLEALRQAQQSLSPLVELNRDFLQQGTAGDLNTLNTYMLRLNQCLEGSGLLQ